MAADRSCWLLLLLQILYITCETRAADCTKDDFKSIALPCNPKTGRRQIVSYKNTDCTLKDTNLVPKPKSAPCDCMPGSGIPESETECKTCLKGTFGSGGEIINNWGDWTVNGTLPPQKSGIATYCDLFRNYVKPCNAWKASFFNDTIESGDNSNTRCLSSVVTFRKNFVMPNSYVSFSYRVDGRKCFRSWYLGCDGLAFFIDNKKVMSYKGIQFDWHSFKANVTQGYHQLKWVYRKSCYSFPQKGLVDKAFIRSITLVGTDNPKSTCARCPPGSYSKVDGAPSCQKCDYFTYQPDAGKVGCIACPPDTYSMLGAEFCYSLRNCTKDDLITAPGPLNGCRRKGKGGDIFQVVTPRLAHVPVLGKDRTLCKNTGLALTPVVTQCRCQPGYGILSDNGVTCRKCANGLHSLDGIKCSKCPNGQVALLGKHYYTWSRDSLPTGFSANCAGDCTVKDGWIPSGDHIRTSRVIGDVGSYLQSPEYEIVSGIAMINFSCSITCNITSFAIGKSTGHHLADIQYCNLVFQVWSNDSIVDQVNCTKPKGRYLYRHENQRDGRKIKHTYPLKVLKNATYTFRWVFQQSDELKTSSASFEGKVYNISIIGVKGGSAMNCTKCPGGSFSVGGNDCSKCPIGTYSEPGWPSCKVCPDGMFSDTPGSSECLRCGANTESLPTRDGCTTKNCTYTPEPGVVYDLNELSREDGPMFEVLTFQRHPPRGYARNRHNHNNHDHDHSITKRRSPIRIWPPASTKFFLNFCTLKHENTSCTYRDSTSPLRKSLPVMACQTSWWSRKDTSLGKVIGFMPLQGKAGKDIRAGLRVEILHGDKCYGKGKIGKYNTTIDMLCDVNAGTGDPGPENNYTQVFRSPCNYYFVWRSMYACPRCNKQDFEIITSVCVDGKANVTYARKVACWGIPESIPDGVSSISCSVHMLSKVIPAAVNSVLIGVGVVVVIGLLCVAGYFFYKHRTLRYKYYGMVTRNKPMSKLEEEEEDFGQVGGDVFNDTHNIMRS